LWHCLQRYKPRKISYYINGDFYRLQSIMTVFTRPHHWILCKTQEYVYILQHPYIKIRYDITVANRPKFQPSYWLGYLIFAVLLPWSLLVNLGNNYINPLNPELNPVCYLLALLGDHHFLHISRIRVKQTSFVFFCIIKNL
jgi:hypothetical protein